MKSLPGGGSPHRMTLAEAEAQTRRDKRRILVLAVGVLLLLGTYITAQIVRPEAEDPGKSLPTGPIADEPVYTLPFESTEVLDTIRDATAEQRLSLSGEALDTLLKYAVTLGPRNYDSLGVRELTDELAAELTAAPGDHRVDPVRARGELLRLTTVATDDRALLERQLAAIRLEGGGVAHLAFRLPTDLEVGDHVRLDGLFVQLYDGMADGELREGPLLAGNQLLASVALTDSLTHEGLEQLLRKTVRDDTVDEHLGEPEELWALMAYAAARADEIDWAAAPVLDNEQLTLISNDGTFFRGQPFQLNICQNMGIWTEAAGENSMRLGRVSRGWIGNTTWKEPAPLIQFVSPADLGELQDRVANRLVTGRAFFLKNVTYKPSGGKSLAMAPLFVLSDLHQFVPVEDRTPEYILFGVLVGTILMIVLIFFLVRADSRSSKKLQEELVRRRRERRARSEQTEATPQSS